jgi:uncharacterized protein with PIN domain
MACWASWPSGCGCWAMIPLGPPPDPALSRCAVCNTTLERVSREDVASRVPPYVVRTQTDFRRCPGCGRVYWPGTHVDGMRERMGEG